jgi:hypothetical protein
MKSDTVTDDLFPLEAMIFSRFGLHLNLLLLMHIQFFLMP